MSAQSLKISNETFLRWRDEFIAREREKIDRLTATEQSDRINTMLVGWYESFETLKKHTVFEIV